MSTARLASWIEVSGLIRRIQGMGGSGVVLARGDGEAGAILLLLADRGAPYLFLHRALDALSTYRWSRTGPQDMGNQADINLYIERRRRADSDLWVIELDVAGVERFAAEMISMG